MHIGVIGGGRMGGGIARRLVRQGLNCTVQDNDASLREGLVAEGVGWAQDIPALVAALGTHDRQVTVGTHDRRVIWVMVPAGQVTRAVLIDCAERLRPGDILIDGGNSLYTDSMEVSQLIENKGISFLDCGTSGGLRGEQIGYCLMVGGEPAVVAVLEPVFAALRTEADTEAGFVHCGPAGAGHFTKMIQNGIEYGMMQSLAEGFHIMARASEVAPEFDLDLGAIAQAWRQGSVVQSWLLDLLAAALADDGALDGFEGTVPDSGTGRWTVNTAIDTSTPAPVLSAALMTRFESRIERHFGNQVLSALRAGFGGHGETQHYRTGD